MTTAAVELQPAPEDAFHHVALLYAGLAEFRVAVGAFVRDGVAADEATMVMVSGDKIDALRDDLGGDAAAVTFVDMTDVGANPARIIPVWLDFASRAGGRRMRGVGEPIYAERSPPEVVECQRHEALLNVAVPADAPFWLVCPYDTEALDPLVVAQASHSHPYLADRHGRRPSRTFRGVDTDFTQPLPVPPPSAAAVDFGELDLPYMRYLVGRHSRAAGLDGAATTDLVLAFNELATNSLRYGGGEGEMQLWSDGDSVVCEVRDRGYIDEPLVGRRRPSPERGGGRGLWMVNQLCDLTQLRTSPAGTTVRVRKNLG